MSKLTTINSMSKEEILNIFEQYGPSKKSILTYVGYKSNAQSAYAAVTQLFIKYNIDLDELSNLYNNQRSLYSIIELQEAVSKSQCLSDVCNLLKITYCMFNIKRLRKLCDANNIILNFNTKKTFRRNHINHEPEDVLIPNSPIHRQTLRTLMFRYGHYTGKCEHCGIGEEYNNKPIVIELDHINGDNRDNRLDNLRWLCPNCHSQTPTYRRGNKKI